MVVRFLARLLNGCFYIEEKDPLIATPLSHTSIFFLTRLLLSSVPLVEVSLRVTLGFLLRTQWHPETCLLSGITRSASPAKKNLNIRLGS